METEIAELKTRLRKKVGEIKKIGDILSEMNKDLEETMTKQQALSVENARLEERAKGADERDLEMRRELDKLHDRCEPRWRQSPRPPYRPDARTEGK